MRAFLDTNVLADFLMTGRPCHDEAVAIFENLQRHTFEAFVTTQSLIDLAYIFAKFENGKEQFPVFTEWITEHINVRPIEVFSINEALQDKNPDFEDNAQISAAIDIGCDVFVTSDNGILSRHSDGSIDFISPSDFLGRKE